MRVSVISAERSVFEGEAESVVAPAYDGLVGVFPRHAPFMTLLGKGIVRISSGGGDKRIQVAGGFLQVARDVVRIVAGSATPADS
jgi:F-type H+-transporting ATPase subunit epsilon